MNNNQSILEELIRAMPH